MPVIPATLDSEGRELLEPGGGSYSEPRLHHCTPAWATRARICLKKKERRKEALEKRKVLDFILDLKYFRKYKIAF